MAWHPSHRGSVYVPDQASAGPSERVVTHAGGSSESLVGQRDLIEANDVEKRNEPPSQPSAHSVSSAFESLNPVKKEASAPTHPSPSSRGPGDYVARVETVGRTTDLRTEGTVQDSQNRGTDQSIQSTFNSIQGWCARRPC